MSNRATIQTTEFIDRPQGKSSLGVRVYDDYEQAYDNTWESIPDDDLDILRRTRQCTDEKIVDILVSIQENEKGIYINQTWYDWDEIKAVFEEDEPSGVVKATYVSVWDGEAIRTSCDFNLNTKTASNIEISDAIIEDGTCERQYIELADGTEIDTFTNADEDINIKDGDEE